MARETIRHINHNLGQEIGLSPVIISCKQSIDDQGDYNTEVVVFQAIT